MLLHHGGIEDFEKEPNKAESRDQEVPTVRSYGDVFVLLYDLRVQKVQCKLFQVNLRCIYDELDVYEVLIFF